MNKINVAKILLYAQLSFFVLCKLQTRLEPFFELLDFFQSRVQLLLEEAEAEAMRKKEDQCAVSLRENHCPETATSHSRDCEPY